MLRTNQCSKQANQIEKGQAYGRDQLIEEFSAKGSELDVVGPEGI